VSWVVSIVITITKEIRDITCVLVVTTTRIEELGGEFVTCVFANWNRILRITSTLYVRHGLLISLFVCVIASSSVLHC